MNQTIWVKWQCSWSEIIFTGAQIILTKVASGYLSYPFRLRMVIQLGHNASILSTWAPDSITYQHNMVQGKQEQGQFDYSDIKGQKINIQVNYVPSEEDFCNEYRNAIKSSQSRGTSSTCTILSSDSYYKIKCFQAGSQKTWKFNILHCYIILQKHTTIHTTSQIQSASTKF
jgi:hypothetical protein